MKPKNILVLITLSLLVLILILLLVSKIFLSPDSGENSEEILIGCATQYQPNMNCVANSLAMLNDKRYGDQNNDISIGKLTRYEGLFLDGFTLEDGGVI